MSCSSSSSSSKKDDGDIETHCDINDGVVDVDDDDEW